jgi:hypothetical protein
VSTENVFSELRGTKLKEKKNVHVYFAIKNIVQFVTEEW